MNGTPEDLGPCEPDCPVRGGGRPHQGDVSEGNVDGRTSRPGKCEYSLVQNARSGAHLLLGGKIHVALAPSFLCSLTASSFETSFFCFFFFVSAILLLLSPSPSPFKLGLQKGNYAFILFWRKRVRPVRLFRWGALCPKRRNDLKVTPTLLSSGIAVRGSCPKINFQPS